ncbi:hypothetical protein [Streptomyces griseoflavus]|uniref:hypothetical protein n=1 Tax=Streptomyces griseoflavus TaxID=35619 RepID=UPI001427B48E|nr:hypothetical protein [Streptomyces griseoflavus]
MTVDHKLKTARAAFVAVAVAAAVGGAVPTAQAATPGYYTICNNTTNFSVQTEFVAYPGEGAIFTSWLAPGLCSVWSSGEDRAIRIWVKSGSVSPTLARQFDYKKATGVDVNVRNSGDFVVVARS